MDMTNHYEANLELRTLYHDITDHFTELESFLKHIHGFVSKTQNKIGKDLKMYSSDFFEYFYASSYGETFRGSFIISISSVSESHIKNYVNCFSNILNVSISNLSAKIGIIDYLKNADKDFFKIGIDFSKKEVVDFKGLLAIRNSIVHSGGNLDYVSQNTGILIKQMTKQYSSIQLLNNNFILTEEQFCNDSLQISKKLFFYLFKLAIKKFPRYIIDTSKDWDFLKIKPS